MTRQQPPLAISALLHLLGYAPIAGFHLTLALAPDSVPQHERVWWLALHFFFVEIPGCLLAIQLGYGLAAAPRPVPPRHRAMLVALAVLVVAYPLGVAWITHQPWYGYAVAATLLPRMVLGWRAQYQPADHARALGHSGSVGLILAAPCILLTLLAHWPFATAPSLYYLLLPLATAALYRRAQTRS